MKFSVSIVVFAVIASAFSVPLKEDSPPKWKDVYTAKGTIYIPYAELAETFTAWYDGPNKNSRIDYYGDMVKTYQLGTYETFGTSIKIVPLTTDEQLNTKTCLQVNGTADETVDTQSVLPDTEGFELLGTETILEKETQKWRKNETIGEKFNRYTLWVYYDTDPDTKESIAVPVKFEMRGYNTLLGSHYDHYYVVYNEFSTKELPKETFQIDEALTCTNFPGPGKKHIYTFNPMAEFIHPVKTSHVEHEFNDFKETHGKSYTDEKEHTLRMETFRQNLRFINSHNRKNLGYTLAVNHLADKSPEELKALRGKSYSGEYNGGKPFEYEKGEFVDVPEQWDWRISGAVSEVKDQSICGSCWAFGAVGAIEGALFLKNGGQLIRLSQQALVDCSWGYGNNGCDGGEDYRVYQWMLKHGGVPTDEAYGPYLGEDGYCHADDVPKVAPITGWVNVTENDEGALRLAIFKKGPVSISIDASQRTFGFYSNGVYYDENCGNGLEDLDHAVLAVGYGSLNGENYWLVKNSWSNLWGNDGYILMSSKNNNCGVMTQPTYVTLE